VYQSPKRPSWLELLTEPGARRRAEFLYTQLDQLLSLRHQARAALVAESRTHGASSILRQIPQLGSVRVAQMIAIVDTPHRFRTKRQFWAYCGLAVVTAATAQYQIVNGDIQKSDKAAVTRGLNRNYNRTLKAIFKGAAVRAAVTEPFKPYYDRLIQQGMRPDMARLTLARKLAAITLKVWKTGEVFDAKKLIEPTTQPR
jgi:transposase